MRKFNACLVRRRRGQATLKEIRHASGTKQTCTKVGALFLHPMWTSIRYTATAEYTLQRPTASDRQAALQEEARSEAGRDTHGGLEIVNVGGDRRTEAGAKKKFWILVIVFCTSKYYITCDCLFFRKTCSVSGRLDSDASAWLDDLQ